MKKKSVLTLIIIFGIILLSFAILNKPHPDIEKETAQCIGQNSVLYIQLGCHACETQEKMFGNNYQHLNVVDCFFEKEKCQNIKYTPTWIINNKKYQGVQDIDKLKELTNC
ncbi:MAG: hypothetical protein ABFQ65_00155 [Nanoarchaeota archaeon]